MCVAIKFFCGVLACWVIINTMVVVGMYIVYLVQRELHKNEDGNMNVSAVGEDTKMLAEMATILWVAIAISNVLMLFGAVGYLRRLTWIEQSEEARPLLQKV